MVYIHIKTENLYRIVLASIYNSIMSKIAPSIFNLNRCFYVGLLSSPNSIVVPDGEIWLVAGKLFKSDQI